MWQLRSEEMTLGQSATQQDKYCRYGRIFPLQKDLISYENILERKRQPYVKTLSQIGNSFQG